eukprot:CAMPEP_0117581532 /NCGR_PEP_ID=MMETSP0784-20121206/65884_1 /TAXON_ID=39447 /ORGANISM="" /LENGTH=167 /DNA_ID=CAMNT_0005381863 /DNA_START=60 /DNA_END=560 /DNA_ORIENTATION=-
MTRGLRGSALVACLLGLRWVSASEAGCDQATGVTCDTTEADGGAKPDGVDAEAADMKVSLLQRRQKGVHGHRAQDASTDPVLALVGRQVELYEELLAVDAELNSSSSGNGCCPALGCCREPGECCPMANGVSLSCCGTPETQPGGGPSPPSVGPPAPPVGPPPVGPP